MKFSSVEQPATRASMPARAAARRSRARATRSRVRATAGRAGMRETKGTKELTTKRLADGRTIGSSTPPEETSTRADTRPCGAGGAGSKQPGVAHRALDDRLALGAERRDRKADGLRGAAEPRERPLGRRRARLDEQRLVQRQQAPMDFRGFAAAPCERCV